jgi:hypothetical protein
MVLILEGAPKGAPSHKTDSIKNNIQMKNQNKKGCIGVTGFMFILLVAFLFAACDKAPPEKPNDEPVIIEQSAYQPRATVVSVAEDTIITSSSTDAFTLDLGSFYGPVEYDLVMFADSLSGGTTGTAILQFSPAMTGSDWYDLATATINGVKTYTRWTGDLVRGRLRVSVSAGSSTQSTAVDVEGAVVPRVPE